jgi:ligand-binding sensor domain-containing protein/signal transduction histidine kinase
MASMSTPCAIFPRPSGNVQTGKGRAAWALLLILVAWPGPAWAQGFLVRNWQTEDGLPDNTVTAIQQTTDGYLWLGTFNGLVRFDGVQFKTYAAANTPALRSSQILSLLADPAGGLWIGTEGGGLVRMANGRFQSVPLAGFGVAESVSALIGDRNGALWILVAGKGVGRLQQGNVQTFAEPDLTGDRLPALSGDPAVQAWLSARNDRLTFRAGSWFWRPSQVPLTGSEVIALQRSRNGSVWLAYHRRLARLPDPVGGIAGASYPWVQEFSSAQVTTVAEDQHGHLWVGTGNGLYASAKPGEYTPVKREGPLFQNLISAIFEDREGLIWVGTYRGGLFRIKQRTVAALSVPGAGESLVLSVCAARDGSVWLGTGGGAGLNHYAEGRFTRYAEAQGLANLMVCTVFEDRHTNLWAGTWGGLFQLAAGRFQRVNPNINLPERVLALYEDRAGALWVGGYGGLARKRGEQWTLLTARDGLSHPDVRELAEDRAGNLWVGTAGGGLDRWRDGRFTHFGAEEGFPQKMVVALLADGEDTLWIGTIAGGLFRFRDGKFTAYTTGDGLADNVVGGILEDAQGHLWLSSQNGILRVHKQVLNQYEAGVSPPVPCLTLSVADGLTSQMCSGSGQPVGARTVDGRLWIPNMKAVAVVDPRLVQERTVAPAVLLEELSIDGQTYAPARDRAVRVPFGRSRFEFHYTALALPVPEAARFRHKLEGLDHDWVNAGVRRVAYYSQLPPGHYQFRVMGAGSDGVWHEAVAPLALAIVPHWWETWWFRVGSGLAVLAAAGFAIRLVERRRLRVEMEFAKRQQAVAEERARIARDIHDDMGSRLTEISLLGALALRESSPPHAIREDVARMTHKTHELVRTLDEIVWAVNPKNDSLSHLATYLCQFAKEFLEPTSVHCRLDIAPGLPAQSLSSEVRHNVFLATKEALNNVVKHAGATELWLRMRVELGAFVLEVADNGKGFSVASVPEGGNGLPNMARRMADSGGQCAVRSAPAQGTTVCLRLPLPQLGDAPAPGI